MPLKAGEVPPYCINHPEEKMVLVNDGNSNWFTILLLTQENPGPIYGATDKGTVVNCYACPICGYVEMYLEDSEVETLQDTLGLQDTVDLEVKRD